MAKSYKLKFGKTSKNGKRKRRLNLYQQGNSLTDLLGRKIIPHLRAGLRQRRELRWMTTKLTKKVSKVPTTLTILKTKIWINFLIRMIFSQMAQWTSTKKEIPATNKSNSNSKTKPKRAKATTGTSPSSLSWTLQPWTAATTQLTTPTGTTSTRSKRTTLKGMMCRWSLIITLASRGRSRWCKTNNKTTTTRSKWSQINTLTSLLKQDKTP